MTPLKPVIRIEKREGKTVTLISGLHMYGSNRLEEICRALKVKFGSVGTVKNGVIELQGNIAEKDSKYLKNL